MRKSKNKGSSKALKRLIFFLLAAVMLWYYSNYTLDVNKTEIESALIKDEIKIVQISDLHGATFGEGNKRLVKKILSQKPDLIAVTGDMYSYGDENGKQTAFELLRELSRSAPVYYISGEHDYYDADFFQSLENAGVNVYNYENGVLKIRGEEIHIYGINNVYYTDTFDLTKAFKKDEKRFSLLLAHSSNPPAFAAFGADLSLCGDTHGGMFRLPFAGAVYDGESFFPDLKGKYMKGLYKKYDSFIYISGGLGAYPAPVRFCNRPEIAVITVKNPG